MAMVLDTFVSEFVQLLVSYGKERIALILGVSEEIKKLHKTMNSIQKVLADAERRQLREDAAVREWLDELKDIMYDAEDIIEEYKVEAEKYIEEGSDSLPAVRCCHPLKLFNQAKSKSQIGEKIKHLNDMLDDINSKKEAFRFEKTTTKEIKQGRISQTTSPLEEPDIVGSAIEDATRYLVDLLTKEDNNKNIMIYAIVGMGGIGKTTLAQKICNDDILLTSFHPVKPTWVCISKDNVDEINILKSIIIGVRGDSINVNERGQLELMLYELVRGKRLFLVLDDLWDAQVWENLLRKPLCKAGKGSRVLLTTRDDGVAMQIGAEYRHKVAKLSDEDGWSLLCKKVFRGSEEGEMHALKETGIQIMNKCGGLPIAINAVVGVLRGKKKTKNDWEKLLFNPIWSFTNVEQAFYLSYDDLPSHLKQCFLYFSLFPEDSVFERDVTHLWIAEGFVKTKNNKLLEETANDYWNELIQRNLLQVFVRRTLSCKMHDLLRKFAQDLVQGECFCGDVNALNEIVSKPQKKLRRWFVHGADEFHFHALNEHTSLRTFIRYRDLKGDGSIDDGLRLLKRTRILKLGSLNLERFPSSFVDLKFLRHLDLSFSKIIELPESIKSFRNLQFLSLCGCSNLRSLPNTIEFLTNLRYLDVRKTKVDKMPKQMVKLQHLRTILGFAIAGSSSNGGTWCTLEDVKHFKDLKMLELYNLERTSGAEEARAAALADQALLTRLQLSSDEHEETYDKETIRIMTEAYEELCPPTSIEELLIFYYYGRKFPSWLIRPSSLMNLTILELYNCPHCEELPSLGQLPQLAELLVYNVGLRRIGLDVFLPNPRDASRCSFPKLVSLCIKYLKGWEEWEDWVKEKEDQDLLHKKIVLLPRLKGLKIDDCYKLRYLPHLLLNHATTLTGLYIFKADKLEAIENLHHIKTLVITNCQNLKRVANLSSLKTLHIYVSGNLQNLEHLPELQLLRIADRRMESLPVLVNFPKLNKLHITGSKVSLLMRCIKDGEEWPNIMDIPQFEMHAFNGCFINYTKSPFSYNTNIDSIEPKDKGLPEQVSDSSLHQHPLTLLPSIAYRCRKCGEEGEGWSFRCDDCLYDLHPNCALQESEDSNGVARGRGSL